MTQKKIRVALIRGGTSKGVFLRDAELAGFDPATRDRILLALFGSPDPRQIDGLGGGTSTTSKVMIVGESSRPGVDLEYTFGQVSLDKSLVDYGGTCGNLTAAVGIFGINEGMVEATDPLTRLVLFNHNTQRMVVAEIPTTGGVADPEGDLRIAGVPGTGARILTRYRDPAGGVTGRLLPTGNPIDTVHVGDKTVSCSIVDAVNPVVFVEASALDLTGRESPAELSGNREALEALEAVRDEAAVLARIVESPGTAAAQSPGVPKVAFVSPPSDYDTVSGDRVRADDINVLARILSMQKAHPAYAVGAAICTAVAALCPGTVVGSAARLDGDPRVERTTALTIGHPVGTIRVELTIEHRDDGPPSVLEAAVERTARYLMGGTAFYRL
jgi:2-methylaconitate cis-trans-isomerase PrpF